jgi:hypothetical protein
MDSDFRTKAAIEEHWRASESGQIEAEHAIYAEQAILDYPSQVNASEDARRLRRSVAGTLPIATSPSSGSPVAAICG